MPELQASFVDFYFTCLVISSPVKAVMADEMLARGYIIFSVSSVSDILGLSKPSKLCPIIQNSFVS